MSPSRSTIGSRISLASGAGASRSPVGLVVAVLLHAAVIMATFVTFEHRLDIAEESPPVVPVDLVTLAAKTNIMATVRPQPHIAPEPVVMPKPEPMHFEAPKVAEAEPAPRADVLPKPVAKPQPKKPPVDAFAHWLDQQTTATPPPANAKPSSATRRPFGEQNAMTMDLRDSLKNQIEQCWNPPAGAPHPEQLIVFIDLELNSDGSVAGKPKLSAQSVGAAAGNPFIRAAADAALRAIFVCAPYKLPPDRFSDWRDSTVEFDPRDVTGQ